MSDQTLVEKIRGLQPERVVEVEDFVDFLIARDQERDLAEEVRRLSANVFRDVWNNADHPDFEGV